jgi:NAD(P)-dependent dehydrogenase (short-subunit alcohol dehydrogenase family)
MRSNIEGKVVVITGASSGMGEVAARHLSAQGATVVLGARRMERLRTLAGEITTAGGKALAVETDVTDRRQVRAWWTRPSRRSVGSTAHQQRRHHAALAPGAAQGRRVGPDDCSRAEAG